jgi:hypothetical protein
MAANKNAGKHPSYDKLNWSPSSIQRKRAYDKKYNESKEAKDNRVELNKANRQAGTYGKMTKMGKDRSHTKDGKMVLESSSSNRGRNGQNGKSTKK